MATRPESSEIVLILDDAKFWRDTHQVNLERLGYTCELADTAEEARRKLKDPSRAIRYALIDHLLSRDGGLSNHTGAGFIRTVRRHRDDVFFVLVSEAPIKQHPADSEQADQLAQQMQDEAGDGTPLVYKQRIMRDPVNEYRKLHLLMEAWKMRPVPTQRPGLFLALTLVPAVFEAASAEIRRAGRARLIDYVRSVSRRAEIELTRPGPFVRDLLQQWEEQNHVRHREVVVARNDLKNRQRLKVSRRELTILSLLAVRAEIEKIDPTERAFIAKEEYAPASEVARRTPSPRPADRAGEEAFDHEVGIQRGKVRGKHPLYMALYRLSRDKLQPNGFGTWPTLFSEEEDLKGWRPHFPLGVLLNRTRGGT